MAERDPPSPSPGTAPSSSPLEAITHGWGRRALSTGKVAASALRLAGRRMVGREAGETDGALGEAMVRELDQMKGLAMKIGQILSYFDGILPPQTHAALRALQTGSRGLEYAVIARQIEAALGAPPDALFDRFDPKPVAAASIGQVHRAELDGRALAVKVQYPDVAATFEADFARITRLSKIASLATAVDGPAIAAELRARIVEECDYRREAAWQRAFAHALRGDPAVQVPEVLPERSADIVLTTAWCEGRDFYAFAEHAPAARRDAAGLALARVALHSFFALGTLNADPHPGNYLFPDGGPIVLLDFGCVRRFDPAFVDGERAVARAVLRGDRPAFRDAVIATGVVPRPDRFDFDLHYEMVRHQYRPYLGGAFRFEPAYIHEGARYTGPSNPNLRRMALPPPSIWWMRLVWGLHAVLARLRAEGDFGAVLRAALDAPWAPPAVDLPV